MLSPSSVWQHTDRFAAVVHAVGRIVDRFHWGVAGTLQTSTLRNEL